MGIVVHAVAQTDVLQQTLAFGHDGVMALAGLLRLGHKLTGQGDVFQRGVLGEQVETLEHHAEMEALFAYLRFRAGGGVVRVKEFLATDGDDALIRGLQEVQAAQQSSLAAAGGTNDGQCLPLFQREADVLQNMGVAEVLFDVLYVQNSHVRHLLSGNS